MSVIFKKLQGYPGAPKLTVDEMVGLWYFLSNLFWRNPENDARFEKTLDIAAARVQIKKLNAQTRREIPRFPEVVLSDRDVVRLMHTLAESEAVQ